ncbi:MAG: phosphoglucomutase [Bacteroidota bacterium]|nr:phosphoglucomutase [Bacteroidota bacterium]
METGKIIFGTDGWRGLIDKEINNDSVALVAQAFADYLNSTFSKTKQIKVAIAYDGRRNSLSFANIIAKVLSGNDIIVYLANQIEPTPVLSYFVKYKQLDAGIMVTASHNPAKYNGLKFKANYGGPFFTEETAKVEALLGKSGIKSNNENIIKSDIRTPYINHLEEVIDFKLIKKSDINILVDSMGGAGQLILENLLHKHNIKCHTIFGIPRNDFYNRLAEPIEKNLLKLSDHLSKEKYSFGCATDGDADRVGVVLDGGAWLSAQYTILLIADYLINKKGYSGDLVKTSSVTGKLNQIGLQKDRKVFDVQVGFKYICEKMIEEDIAFGAEESGGFGYKNHMPERDGILSSLIIAEMLASSKYKSLKEYFYSKKEEFGDIFYSRIDMEYLKPDRIEILPSLYKNLPPSIADFEVTNSQIFYSSRGIINGLKLNLQGNARWLLIRASETEPIIRIYAEGESDLEVNNILSAGQYFFK